MPAKDIYHEKVKRALMKDGWTITHDPLKLKWGLKDMYVDLGAEQFFGAEKDSTRIAVEVKSFLSASSMNDLENAIGQYIVYHEVLCRIEPERALYLAVREETWQDVFEEPIGKLLLDTQHLRLLIFDEHEEVVLKWII
ncbi:MAG: XisH family protein [Acidobacteriota bacterium]